MPGIPLKLFELEIAPLQPQRMRGIPGAEIAPGLKGLFDPARWEKLQDQVVVPLGLRWRVRQDMGLPRTPFSVWRRDRRRPDPIDVIIDENEIDDLRTGNNNFRVRGHELYVLQVAIRNLDVAIPVTVQALDTLGRPLPFQSVEIPGGFVKSVRFQHPFLGGFSCRGFFQISGLAGVTMQSWIDHQDDWELIEIVGLPANEGEIEGYDTGPQGYPSQLKDAPSAALDRLQIAQQFYLPLPTTLPSGVTVPEWKIPTADEALEELRGEASALIAHIAKMLRAVDQHEVDEQADYRAGMIVPGIRQPEFPDRVTEDATVDLPLLATVLLNAATDPWFALTSGFGTTDFPEFYFNDANDREPPVYFDVRYDYMVSAEFHFRHFGIIEYKKEYCALSHRSAMLTQAPGALDARPHGFNRPPSRDAPWSAEVALTWAKNSRFQIQGNAVAVAENGLVGNYLNSPRSLNNSELLALFVPAKPGQTGDPELLNKNRFIHHQTPVRFVATRTNGYGVATMDAFGRWGEWSTTNLDLAARLPESPRLMALSLTPDKSRIQGNRAPHELLVEILWDWQDRSPKRLQMAAVFHRRKYFPDGSHDDGHVPPTEYPAIFQTDNTQPAGALIELIFASDAPPGTPPAFDSLPTCADPRVVVELLPQATDDQGRNVDGEMRRYRLRMRDFDVTFAPDEEWYFTLFVKAAEWRAPNQLSDTTPPIAPNRPPHLTTYVPNPIPAPPPVFVPAEVEWATLPDARGVSRYRLAFDPMPGATGGYAVFRAFEAKLRDLAGLPVRADPDLVGRATELRDVAMPLATCLDAFSRLNAKLIPPPAPGARIEYEIELPGTFDGLMAVAVASVTREQETSPLSTPWLFVAVPRRAQPAVPMLSVAQHNGRVTLTGEVAKAPRLARVEILRVQREFASRQADTMGLPLHESLPAGWQPLNERGGPAASEAETSKFRFSFEDATPPSWFPYFYRAVAIGAQDDTSGVLPGRSPQSNLVKVENLPRGLPTLVEAGGEQIGEQTVRLHFQSDALLEATPHGNFRLEIFAWDAAQGRFPDTPALQGLFPEALPRPEAGILDPGTLYFSPADAAGMRTFEALLEVSGDAYLFRVRLTDPLNRSTERLVSGKIEHHAAPHLADLRVRRNERDLLIAFESTTATEQPPSGEYVLEIGFAPRPSPIFQRLFATLLHEIPVGDLATLRTSPVTRILRAPELNARGASEYGAVIKRFFPPSPFPIPRPGRLLVRLTAPDGTEAKLEIET